MSTAGTGACEPFDPGDRCGSAEECNCGTSLRKAALQCQLSDVCRTEFDFSALFIEHARLKNALGITRKLQVKPALGFASKAHGRQASGEPDAELNCANKEPPERRIACDQCKGRRWHPLEPAAADTILLFPSKAGRQCNRGEIRNALFACRGSPMGIGSGG
jgi:hypothetical protein